jgi:hypothetical protein
LATTDDVAAAALFLASPEGAFLNGVALPVDGGLTAYLVGFKNTVAASVSEWTVLPLAYARSHH